MSASESEIQARIMKRLGLRSDMRLWRQNTGVALTLDKKRMTTFGVKGGGDLSGLLRPFGTRLEIEVKSERGRQSEQQQRFQEMIESFGGVYVLARNENEAEEQIAEKRGRGLYAVNEDLRAAMSDEEWADYLARLVDDRARWVQTWTEVAEVTRKFVSEIESRASRTPEDMRLIRACKQSLADCEAMILAVAT